MKIFYIDDEQSALDEFMHVHATDGISVEACQDIHKLQALLGSRSSKDLPDLIVMDLYRTKGELGTESAEATNRRVDELVSKIAETRRELQSLVALQKEPAAIDALEALRNEPKLKNIPVIICTREGLNLIDDTLLRKSIKLGADWMLKGRAPEVIRELMQRSFSESHQARRRLERDVALMLAGSVLGAALGYLLGLGGT